ncbi:MAG: chemotaxis protein CheX [Planctomycetes bacterium]|uniref:chemotaxis protein CheX n=1 Tax=Candidatus Wunengus sp. YC65 TaxID=3367701 RepID=UPI001E189CD5|nr:chemotaxis protein CheX [Planctomycetota bacterium]
MAIEGIMENVASDITSATKTLFETMIMLDLKYDNSFFEDDTQIKTDVIGMVSFTGKYHGVIALFCSKKFALKVASTMLMTDLTDFTNEVKDAVGEVSNMIAGNVKTKLTAQYGEMNLSIPIVIAGEGLSITAVNNHPVVAETTLSCFSKDPWLMTPFISSGEKFDVGLLLKESSK